MRDSVGEKPPGVGGRFSYNFHGYAAFDAELNYFSNEEAGLNHTQGLFGVKVGRRFGSSDTSPSYGFTVSVRVSGGAPTLTPSGS